MDFSKKNIRALNPFHSGSHKAFINGWICRSAHSWDLLTLPGSYWKWRLLYAAADFLPLIKSRYESGVRWDAVYCTSMMNAAELRGLFPFLNNIPLVVYFHENQLTYPEGKFHKFDRSLCAVNVKSALAADEIWFNSDFHRTDFLTASELFAEKYGSDLDLKSLADKSRVEYQAIEDDLLSERTSNPGSPVKLVWASRWEEEKNPGLLFLALRKLREKGVAFQISVLGEEMGTCMPCFDEAREEFKKEILHFGYAESRDIYIKILKEADIFISTANHEFFGISAVEAAAAGCIPVIPEHLAYPEVLSAFSDFFYKPESSVQLIDKITAASQASGINPAAEISEYLWSKRAGELDKSLLSCERQVTNL